MDRSSQPGLLEARSVEGNVNHAFHEIIIIPLYYMQNYTFPEDVAFPIGGFNRPFKIMLEVHYDNPGMNDG